MRTFRPNDENFPSGPSSVLRSFELFQLASVRTFMQHIQTTLNVRPAMEFLSKTQIWEDNCNCSDDVDSCPDALIHKASCTFKIQTFGQQLHGLDARATYMEISCIWSTVRTTITLVRTREALIWKLYAAEVWPSGRQGNTVRTWLKSGKNFSKIFGKPISQLSVQTPYVHRLDGA
jgi:hypothetical protein